MHNSLSRLSARRGFCGLQFLLFVFILGCTREDVPAGKILIKNDILDKEFNSFVVDEVMTKSGRAGFRKSIKPGERITIPMKGITSLRFTRDYKDHSNIYIVHCPEDAELGISMNLIDVHSNRLPQDCKLVKKGVRHSGGVIDWEDNK